MQLRRLNPAVALATLLAAAGCAAPTSAGEGAEGTNPFLDDGSGKEDTGYINSAGLEVEVTLESDISVPSSRVFDAPADLAQYAVTYLRKRHEFYLELLAEDSTAPERVEWLVDGSWISHSEAQSVDRAKLTHFRMQNVNAVLLNRTASSISAGQAWTARVPAKQYSIFSDAGDKCADYNSHIHLDQGVYWYLWNPERSGCSAELTDLTVTIEELLPRNPPSYPEYDELWKDNELTAVVLFGELDDGSDIHNDYNWAGADRFGRWLEDAGFVESTGAPIGRRFVKTSGELKTTIDIYYPDAFRSVVDYANMANWQRAVSEHEVVIYLGHSVLGTGSAYSDVRYPSDYQIFVIGGCLGYEYYVRPVLEGKGGWENVDTVSSIVENGYGELNNIAGSLLGKLIEGFEHGGSASWQDILGAMTQKLGHSHFGASGARDNCFSPQGDRCDGPPPVEGTTYENTTPVAIPDNDPAGVDSTIEVPDSTTIASLTVEIDIAHTYTGDLKVVLSHGGAEQVLWDNAGGGGHDIHARVPGDGFRGMNAGGTWSLRVVDSAAVDTGSIERWALVVTPQG